ncbi:MAG: exonuclease domain-containing protein [archaeon]
MIVFDVETTGLNPKKNSIVSIGAVEFENSGNQFYGECRPSPGAEISDEALAVNGFTREQLNDPGRSLLSKTLESFIDWVYKCNERTLAGHNLAVFDFPFLKEAMRTYSIGKWPFGNRTVDSHALCYAHHISKGMLMPVAMDKGGNSKHRSGITLDVALNYVGIPGEPKPHNALTGAKSAAEVISRLTKGECLFPEYSQFKVPGYL